MDAIAILKLEHRLLLGSMAVMARSTDHERKKMIVRFKRQVEIHNFIEEGIFYEAVGARIPESRLRLNREERRFVEKALADLAFQPIDAPDWIPYFNMTRGMLIRHMRGEEETCFSRVRDGLDRSELAEIGRSLLSVKERMDAVHSALQPGVGATPSEGGRY